jgi:flavin-dependent dehydrogenase
MKAGKLAAETVVRAIQRDNFSEKGLSEYERKWVKAFGSDLKWGLWLQKRFLDGGSGSLGSGFLGSEKSRRIIAEMLLGMRPVKNAIIRAIPGYLKSKI